MLKSWNFFIEFSRNTPPKNWKNVRNVMTLVVFSKGFSQCFIDLSCMNIWKLLCVLTQISFYSVALSCHLSHAEQSSSTMQRSSHLRLSSMNPPQLWWYQRDQTDFDKWGLGNYKIVAGAHSLLLGGTLIPSSASPWQRGKSRWMMWALRRPRGPLIQILHQHRRQELLLF